MEDISARRQHQIEKWGGKAFHYPNKPWIAILGEEFGEVCRNCLESSEESMYDELIDLATVAAFFAEEIKRHET